MMIVGMRREEKRYGSWRKHGKSLRAMISTQGAFTLCKSRLINLFAFCVETTRSVNGRRAVGVICSAYCAVASTVLPGLEC